jgi:hypothetical protein
MPVNSRQFLPSNSAAKEWCAKEGVASNHMPQVIAAAPSTVEIFIGTS